MQGKENGICFGSAYINTMASMHTFELTILKHESEQDKANS